RGKMGAAFASLSGSGNMDGLVRFLRLAIALPVIASIATAADPPKPDPLSNYEAHERQGFKVMLNKRLTEGGPALKCLDEQLAETVRVIPGSYTSLLHDVKIWIEPGPARSPIDGLGPDVAAFYVPLDDHSEKFILRDKRGGISV